MKFGSFAIVNRWLAGLISLPVEHSLDEALGFVIYNQWKSVDTEFVKDRLLGPRYIVFYSTSEEVQQLPVVATTPKGLEIHGGLILAKLPEANKILSLNETDEVLLSLGKFQIAKEIYNAIPQTTKGFSHGKQGRKKN